MSPVARTLAAIGLLLTLVGLGLAWALDDRFLGLAVVIVGAFLLVLPFTRPSVDE